MPWARINASSCAIQGEDGEWIATCANAEIAKAVIDDHNSNETLGELFIREHPRSLRVDGARFDEHVDAVINLTDQRLPQGWMDSSQSNNGWTNRL